MLDYLAAVASALMPSMKFKVALAQGLDEHCPRGETAAAEDSSVRSSTTANTEPSL